MDIQIKAQPFDPWQEVKKHQDKHLSKGKYGALALFVGTMRDVNLGDQVKALRIEHYQGMVEKCLTDALTYVNDTYDIEDTLIIHRVGTIHQGDPIVLVAVWSAHREDAFAVNRFLVEELKSRVPFWKKETLAEGTRWVTPAKA